jgi:5'(3')-deoxyribonucleotidase
MSTTLTIGTDLDGVLANFGRDFVTYMKKIGLDYSFDPHEEPQEWNFHHKWGMSIRDFTKHCHDGVDAGIIFRGEPRPGAVETMWKIHDEGHKIVVITDRHFGSFPSASQIATHKWWKEYGFPQDNVEIYFSADKTLVPTDIFIEDKVENYDALIEDNTPCYLINRPWNGDPKDGRMRLNDITEYPGVIAKIFQPA